MVYAQLLAFIKFSNFIKFVGMQRLGICY